MLDLSLPKREAMSEAEDRDLSDASLTKASRRDPALRDACLPLSLQPDR
jgi:hypothetical protein